MDFLKSQTSKIATSDDDSVVVKALRALSQFKEVNSFLATRHAEMWDDRFPRIKSLVWNYYKL